MELCERCELFEWYKATGIDAKWCIMYETLYTVTKGELKNCKWFRERPEIEVNEVIE